MYIVYAVYSTYKCSRLCVIKLEKCIKVEIILGLEKKILKNSIPFYAFFSTRFDPIVGFEIFLIRGPDKITLTKGLTTQDQR